MPAYAYEALDAQGHTRKGVIDADTVRAARTQLRGQGLVPLQVDAVGLAEGGSAGGTGDGPHNTRLFARKVLSPTGRAVFTRQLAGLVSAGLPLERALAALAEEADDVHLRNLLAGIRAEVNAGSALGRALGLHPREFGDVYVAVVSAGEQSGQLGTVLERLADELEAQLALRSKLVGAALYPAIVAGIAVCIVLFLLGYVVPQVAGVYASGKRALPGLTVAMLAIAGFVREWGWGLLIAIVLIAISIRLASARPQIAEKFDAWYLRLPVLGRLARLNNGAGFAATLAMLTSAGVPILRALQTAADTLPNRALRADALLALGDVREGAPLASALAQHTRFPPLIAMFARLGEQTGQLPLMLQRASTQVAAEVQRRAMALATALEPVLIVGMGAVVLLIVLAVLMPIIQLNQWAR